MADVDMAGGSALGEWDVVPVEYCVVYWGEVGGV